MRKGGEIGLGRSIAVLLLILPVVTSAAFTAAGSSRFAPNEIIVKFRARPTEVFSESFETDSKPIRDLSTPQGRIRVREWVPLVRGRDRGRQGPQEWNNLSAYRMDGRNRRRFSAVDHRVEPTPIPPFDRIYRIKLDPEAGVSPEEVLEACRSRSDVEFAELNPVVSVCATPGDPSYGRQWSLVKIQAPQAWDTCQGDTEIVVAIIDTGVDYNHRDLQGNLWVNEAELNGIPGVDDDHNGYVDDVYGYNFAYNTSDPMDDHGHGTHCAGIVAAAGDNGLDVAGVCWRARIMSLKMLGADGDGTAAAAVPAIYYAVENGADIISGSWGGPDSSEALRQAIVYAQRHGVVVVAAAGNENSASPYYPAAYANVLSVAATDSSDRRWSLSNYGDWVDIAAPGRDIVSLGRSTSGNTGGSLISTKSGTSMAAPHVSGVCALLLSANPLLASEEVLEILTTTGDPIAEGICSSNARLNAYNALRAAIPSNGRIRLDRQRYAQDASVEILVADWDLRGAGRQTVRIDAASGDKEAVTLTESEVSLGVFRGRVVVRKAVPVLGDGVLQLQNGQNFVVQYRDADDGLGHTGQWHAAAAVVDYQPPTVLDVHAVVSGVTATIRVLASEPVQTEIRYGQKSGGPYDRIERGWQFSESPDIELSNLRSRTTYYYEVAVTDEAGNVTLANNAGLGYTFVTASRTPGL